MRMLVLILLSSTVIGGPARAEAIVGSKKFTESILMGEIIRQLADSSDVPMEHKREIGGTRILWEAMLRKDIDIYSEYTGTIQFEILRDQKIQTWTQLRDALARQGIGITRSLGFENTYSLGIKRTRAQSLGIARISDLRRHPGLVYGLSHEFMERRDGWPGLSARYGLKPVKVRGVDHEIGYRGVADGATDIIDLYTTDAEIAYYDLIALKDDLKYFPSYEAVFVYRADADTKLKAIAARLEGRIPVSRMIQMNTDVKIHKLPVEKVAQNFLREELGVSSVVQKESLLDVILGRTLEHVVLVTVSLVFAILVSVPLGYYSSKHQTLGGVILASAGVIQTIPSLALLVFMIPVLGIGTLPALVALFLYSLLPIVRATYLGFSSITDTIRESAASLGLTDWFQFRRIYWPLALRSMLSGIKTSAVINVGVATLGALIGAGGYGQTILKGIRLDDTQLILAGAVPAALMALMVQGIFDLLERMLVSKGLRG